MTVTQRLPSPAQSTTTIMLITQSGINRWQPKRRHDMRLPVLQIQYYVERLLTFTTTTTTTTTYDDEYILVLLLVTLFNWATFYIYLRRARKLNSSNYSFCYTTNNTKNYNCNYSCNCWNRCYNCCNCKLTIASAAMPLWASQRRQYVGGQYVGGQYCLKS